MFEDFGLIYMKYKPKQGHISDILVSVILAIKLVFRSSSIVPRGVQERDINKNPFKLKYNPLALMASLHKYNTNTQYKLEKKK